MFQTKTNPSILKPSSLGKRTLKPKALGTQYVRKRDRFTRVYLLFYEAIFIIFATKHFVINLDLLRTTYFNLYFHSLYFHFSSSLCFYFILFCFICYLSGFPPGGDGAAAAELGV